MLRAFLGLPTKREVGGPRPVKVARVDLLAGEMVWYVHRLSQKLHLLRGQSEKPILDRVLACGRMLSDTYTRASPAQQGLIKCAMCARTLPEDM